MSVNQVMSDVVRMVFFPALHRRWNPGARQYLKDLKQIEFASLDRLQELQDHRLKKLMEHAYSTVPYYKEMGPVPKLSDAPILTKEILRSRLEDLVSQPSDKQALTLNTSGGSTGTPVKVYQDVDYRARGQAAQWFVEGWWGIRPGEKTAAIWGNDRDLPPQSLRERIAASVVQQRGCNAFKIDEATLARFAHMLSKWKPGFVIGYSSALHVFARYLLTNPSVKVRPKAVKSTAEVLLPVERTVIEQAFQAPLYDFYGSREVNNVAAECECHDGLHINWVNRVVELVDQDGNAVPPGTPGRILVTDLSNFGMPMIRYENEDVAAWQAGTCKCGRAFPRLQKIFGRKSDFLLARDGRIIHGEFFTHLFYGVEQVEQFRVTQESIDKTRLELVLKKGLRDFDASQIISAMKKSLGEGTEVMVEYPERIERSASGKFRFTVSKLPMPWGPPKHEKVSGPR